MNPRTLLQPFERVCHACHVGLSLAGERRRNMSPVVQDVRFDVVGPEPVEAPHVLAPADHLADETLGRVDRDLPVSVRLFDTFTDFVRHEQPHVEVGTENRMGEAP